MLDVSRKELKYPVGIGQIGSLRGKLAALMQEDVHNGAEGYLVRSLYFDSPYDSDFEDKVDGYDKRQKIRLRVYDPEDSTVKLELKEKSGNAQRKRSLTISRGEAQRMMAADYEFLLEREEPLAGWLYGFMSTRCYRPKCIVEYDRAAYLMDMNDIRITFDQNLRATEGDLNLFAKNLMLYPVGCSTEATMEVKYNGFLFSYIKEIVSLTERMQVSSSKYCRARELSKHGRV